jgi:hypothetical protein
MVFLVVGTYTYDLLLGLDFFMKIGAMVDLEKGTIHVRHGPRVNMEMLPLNIVNIVQYGETQTHLFCGTHKESWQNILAIQSGGLA